MSNHLLFIFCAIGFFGFVAGLCTGIFFKGGLKKIISEDFTKIANQTIKNEQKDLREQNREALEEKFKPLKENFEQFKKKVEEFNLREEKNNASLKTQIEMLLSETTNIKTTAEELTNAIKNNSQARGEFGEIILENLLLQAGLINKREDEEKGNFITQKTFKDLLDPIARPKPDAVVFFPDEKHVVIDSKCPLNNFLDFTNAKNENERTRSLELFFQTVNSMIEDLSVKYNSLEGLTTPEFKLMFIPLEATASYIYSNKKIINKAMSHNIIIVCPSTLFAVLKIINKVWTQKIQKENLTDILQTAGSAYDKLCRFIKTLEEIDAKFNALHLAFEDCFKTACGRGGFLGQIENLRKLGMATKNKVEEKYLGQ